MCGRAADEVGCTRTDADGVIAGVVSLDGAAGNAANIIGRGHLQDIMRRVAVCEDCENIMYNKYFASDVSNCLYPQPNPVNFLQSSHKIGV